MSTLLLKYYSEQQKICLYIYLKIIQIINTFHPSLAIIVQSNPHPVDLNLNHVMQSTRSRNCFSDAEWVNWLNFIDIWPFVHSPGPRSGKKVNSLIFYSSSPFIWYATWLCCEKLIFWSLLTLSLTTGHDLKSYPKYRSICYYSYRYRVYVQNLAFFFFFFFFFFKLTLLLNFIVIWPFDLSRDPWRTGKKINVFLHILLM